MPRKLILRNDQSPGDIVMLTAAVRDLHARHPGEFFTDVRTPCPELWTHNPHVTAISDWDSQATIIDCDYPLIHRSNQEPHHFVEGFTDYLSRRLKLPIESTAFKGDVHLSDEEKGWMSQVQEIVGEDLPFWLIVAGGKRDYTIKWWDPRRFQAVVNAWRGRVLFVQIGEQGHHHPPLQNVIDLRGRTDLRQLVRLAYHAEGVVCPVTLLMHLAAAVETRPERARHRPCVVVAGGREPPHWEAYPHHQFVHTVGALACCDEGGCWRSRTVALGDGDDKDRPENLCLDVVGGLPRCMDLITAPAIVERMEMYFKGGVARYLTPSEWRAAEPALSRAPLAAVAR